MITVITVITTCDGDTADYYVGVLKGRLTPEQRRELRGRDNGSNMFFREFNIDGDCPTYDEADRFKLYNVDGEGQEPVKSI